MHTVLIHLPPWLTAIGIFAATTAGILGWGGGPPDYRGFGDW